MSSKPADSQERVEDLLRAFAQLPRSGDTVYGFAAGLYPPDYPTLPDASDDPGEGSARRQA